MANTTSSPPQARLDVVRRAPVDHLAYYDTATHCYIIAVDPDKRLYYHVLKFRKYDADANNGDAFSSSFIGDVQGNEAPELDMQSMVCTQTEAQALVDALRRDCGDVRYGRLKALMGCVRFTRGYYLVAVTKRKLVARIGIHRLYEVADTMLIDLNVDKRNRGGGGAETPSSEDSNVRGMQRTSGGGIAASLRQAAASLMSPRRTAEDHYREQFQSVSLNDTFYYSHTYDLTNTLQTHMTVHEEERTRRVKYIWNDFFLEPFESDEDNSQQRHDRHYMSSAVLHPLSAFVSTSSSEDSISSSTGSSEGSSELHHHQQQQQHRPAFADVSGFSFPASFDASVWLVYCMRGAITQKMVQVGSAGRPSLLLTLIARVSKQFTGARYLRRGVSADGHAANHVEVEQIVCDEATLQSHYTQGAFSSYVQVRGSVPVRWFHPASANLPKPSVSLGQDDPYFNATCKHFQEILSDYGAPLVLLDYMKKQEWQPRETVIGDAYRSAVEMLRAAVRRHHHDDDSKNSHRSASRIAGPDDLLRYKAIDLRRVADHAWNVVTAAAEEDDDDIGFFACRADGSVSSLQRGVVRSNCVDCIDRTNVGQFIFSLHALGRQLERMQVLHAATDMAHSPAVQEALLSMYLFLGDAIATQYGGSAQVGAGVLHRGAGWDQIMGIKRLYNNMMGDRDKQSALNLFLGRFQPCPRAFSRSCNPTMHPGLLRANMESAWGLGESLVVAASQDMDGGDAGVAPTIVSSIPASRTAQFLRRGAPVKNRSGGGDADADYYMQVKSCPQLPDTHLLHAWWVAPLVWRSRLLDVASPALLLEEQLSHATGNSSGHSDADVVDDAEGHSLHREDEDDSWLCALSLRERALCFEPLDNDVTATSKSAADSKHNNNNNNDQNDLLVLEDNAMVQPWSGAGLPNTNNNKATHAEGGGAGRYAVPCLLQITPTISTHCILKLTDTRWQQTCDRHNSNNNNNVVLVDDLTDRSIIASVCCGVSSPLGLTTKVSGAVDELLITEEYIHSHTDFPSQVWGSLYAVEQTAMERMCEDDIMNEGKMGSHRDMDMMCKTLEAIYGPPASWSADVLVDALQYAVVTVAEDGNSSGKSLQHLRSLGLTGQKGFLQTLRQRGEFMALLPTEFRPILTRLVDSVKPPSPPSLHENEAGLPDAIDTTVRRRLQRKRDALLSLCASAQPFFLQELTPENIHACIRTWYLAVNDAVTGVPRRCVVRFTDEVHRGATRHHRIPEAVVVPDFFSAWSLHAWLLTHSEACGLSLHRHHSVEKRDAAGWQMMAWAVQVNLLVVAREAVLASAADSTLTSMRIVTELFSDRTIRYRFAGDAGLEVLNAPAIHSCSLLQHPIGIAPAVSATALAEALASLALSAYTSTLRSTAVADTETYAAVVGSMVSTLDSGVAALRTVSLSTIGAAERLGFFINIYNSLYVHAWLHASVRSGRVSNESSLDFYDGYGYAMGPFVFSLSDIKNGLLGGSTSSTTCALLNALPPLADPEDPRLDLIPPQLTHDANNTDDGMFASMAETMLTEELTLLDAQDKCCVKPVVPSSMPRRTAAAEVSPAWRRLCADTRRYTQQRVLLALMDTYVAPPGVLLNNNTNANTTINTTSTFSEKDGKGSDAQTPQLDVRGGLAAAPDTTVFVSHTLWQSEGKDAVVASNPNSRRTYSLSEYYCASDKTQTPRIHLCQPMLAETWAEELQRIEANFLFTASRVSKANAVHTLLKPLLQYDVVFGTTAVDAMHAMRVSQESSALAHKARKTLAACRQMDTHSK